jgi:hypothetical protein
MIEQISNTLRFHAFFTASKVGKTGLTVTVDVRRNGTLVVTGDSAVEEGGGLYYYDLSGGTFNTVEGSYTAVFKTADGTVDFQHVPALWLVQKAGVENLDALISSRAPAADVEYVIGTVDQITADLATKPTAAEAADAVWDEALAGHMAAGSAGEALDAAGGAADPLLNAVPGVYSAGTAGAALGKIGTGVFEVDSPIGPSGNVSVVRGDDYAAADNRQIDFIGTTVNQWPDLTGATLAFTAREISSDAVILTKVPTVVTPTGTQKFRLELASADTKNLGARTYKYDVEATLSSTRKVTLASGDFKVIEDQTR